ncbi:MAG: hypothetical protein ACKVK0_00040 [Pirellulales bacterium]
MTDSKCTSFIREYLSPDERHLRDGLAGTVIGAYQRAENGI